MEIKAAVAENLRRLRLARNLSTEQLAAASGVSKSMLNQIERGEANPSIGTVWKIALGLDVDFNALTFLPKQDIELISIKDLPPIPEAAEKVTSYLFFPHHKNGKFTVYHVEVEPGGEWRSHPHVRGTVELITVSAGQLTVHMGDRSVTVSKDECLKFNADIQHSYRNSGEVTAVLNMLLY